MEKFKKANEKIISSVPIFSFFNLEKKIIGYELTIKGKQNYLIKEELIELSNKIQEMLKEVERED